MIHEATGVNVRSLYHDISTVTGEKIVIVILTTALPVKNRKRLKITDVLMNDRSSNRPQSRPNSAAADCRVARSSPETRFDPASRRTPPAVIPLLSRTRGNLVASDSPHVVQHPVGDARSSG
ncbi:MAG: Na-translocating system protein MpsC family protein [Planctomycetota bacterium]|nr:Na-translocating system protein MpsC family protein [Planctomycetota bacterium]